MDPADLREEPVSRFELLCLDLDGTLVDSLRDIQCALTAAFAAVPLLSADAVDAADAAARAHEARFIANAGLGCSLREIFEAARPGRGAELTRFMDTYVAFYAEHGLRHTRPFPGVEAALAALQPMRQAGLRIAIATTKRTETATRVCRGLGLDRYLDVIVGSESLPPKPAPDVLLRCAALTGADPKRGMMVGDMPGDILAGKAAGMRTGAVTTGVLPRAELERCQPDWIVERFDDVVELVTSARS